MKKYLKIVCITLFSLFIITGCSTYKSYTYDLETGDKIKIQLNTSNGYDMTSELPFSISKDGEMLSQCTFITFDGYNQYISSISSDSSVKIIDSGNEDEITYIFYSYNDTEFNYIIKIDDSKTGMLLANSISEESAKECFDRLTISKE